MKRLKAQYARVDPDTHISDRAWAQRLLNRCSLGRRDRLDVFFSAGGLYEPAAIERALRHRCARVHEDERRTPQPSKFSKHPMVRPRSREVVRRDLEKERNRSSGGRIWQETKKVKTRMNMKKT